jgi:1-deoxy-D-xylulose-5-phosphate reductoisomerase
VVRGGYGSPGRALARRKPSATSADEDERQEGGHAQMMKQTAPRLDWVRRIVIAGSTGSIGTQALDVVSRSRDLEVVALAAGSNDGLLVEQAEAFGVTRIGLADERAAARAAERWTAGEVLSGPDGLVKLVTDSGADLVLNALVGSAGLGPTVASLGEGIDLALANKESLVVGGELVMALAEATGASIIPVDSEHSALFQLIRSERRPGTIDRLVLTASGGPFRGRSRDELQNVTVEEALQHPTWAMGGKITIDSATLMNKGLELIEAHHLFGVPYDQIDVVVHPQSTIHALIHLNDGAALAHMGNPDMRVPISYALHFPERADVPVEPLDLPKLGRLTFEEPDERAFPCLRLARTAAAEGGTAPCVMNAANEVAVQAFLAGQLGFNEIPEMIERALESVERQPLTSFDDLYLADAQARRVVEGAVA